MSYSHRKTKETLKTSTNETHVWKDIIGDRIICHRIADYLRNSPAFCCLGLKHGGQKIGLVLGTT